MADKDSTITLKVDHSDLIAALEKHAKALDRNTNTLLDAKNGRAGEDTKQDKKVEAKAVDKPKGPTREDVVKALKDHAALEGKESAIAILKDLGADSVSDLDPDKYQSAMDKAAGK